ncbi:universal stress protein [Sphingomonas aurantiaca]|uniref:universal stress protein n=1 Tax=Sphingomonas aurantiaca TaxID=185949 RepID=UPI002FE2A3A9
MRAREGCSCRGETTSLPARLRGGGALDRQRGETPAETLTLYAKEQKADLLVIGGFAHSRVRDIVLGVTRDFVEASTVPILIVG